MEEEVGTYGMMYCVTENGLRSMYAYMTTLLCACRSRGPSRTSSRAPSRSASTSLHPVNGAKASGDAPQRQQHHQDEEQPQQQPEGTSNEQMVWEMLYNPQFSLPVAEAEAAWGRAIGQQEEEEVSLISGCHGIF